MIRRLRESSQLDAKVARILEFPTHGYISKLGLCVQRAITSTAAGKLDRKKPQAETAYRNHLNEQAAYFGITREQAVEIAHEAAAFTGQQLAAPFTIWTRWRSALGRSALERNYCNIITADGRDLNELLVENGLARIYGTRTTLYDGQDSKAYLARRMKIEGIAKRERRGAWRFTP